MGDTEKVEIKHALLLEGGLVCGVKGAVIPCGEASEATCSKCVKALAKIDVHMVVWDTDVVSTENKTTRCLPAAATGATTNYIRHITCRFCRTYTRHDITRDIDDMRFWYGET